jgi:uncharacterized protein (TIGR01244 family)
LLGGLAACATPATREPAAQAASPTPAPVARAPLKTVERGRILIAGQPGAADLEALRAQGVTAVFNVRTPEEMANPAQVDFDESATVAALGMRYELQPLSSPASFKPEVLDAFTRALEGGDGKVLLHCASGARAGTLYAAYAMKVLGEDPDTVLRSLEPLGLWPLTLERLTGIPLKVSKR